MKKYERPVVLVNEELAEGVYAASGANAIQVGCWTASGAGRQESVTARTDWRFQIDGYHIAEAHAAKVYITFVFDQDISTADFSGYPKCSLSGKTAVFELSNLSGGVNGNEAFGGAALNVETVNAVTAVTLESVTITDGGAY